MLSKNKKLYMIKTFKKEDLFKTIFNFKVINFCRNFDNSIYYNTNVFDIW